MQEIESLMMLNLYKFRKLNERKLENVMKKYDLRKIDMDIIICLATYKDMRTAKDIASLEMFTKGHISQSIKRLKERGYIIVSQDENDMRMQNQSFMRFVQLRMHLKKVYLMVSRRKK